ncbi:hypothetical protein BD410DRAFT_812418 [Rickenella mellea]|uniref:Prolyl 4-hydroxylase alpha subunit domain-containing protein n=1 Tax=Rickenella mellea TaxID=50990 RepID=A0A4Y7QKG9_9AGAM|nr:hypothetical protein BD410DRAFT_812418 [Rickenella mellea]
MPKASKKALKPNPPVARNEVFPPLATKRVLTCHHVEPDQIITIQDVITAEECKTFVNFIDNLPLELTPPKKRGEADRVNHRLSILSTEFAQNLFVMLAPHLPEFPFPASAKRTTPSGRKPHSFNPNIRLYKYTPNQHFGPHYDESVRDMQTGAHSEWTVLVYLTGEEDGVLGGEASHGKTRDAIKPPLKRGTALLHRSVHSV